MPADAKRPSGFTLIEVLAAVALSSLLLLVLVTVAASVKRDERHLAAHAAQGVRHARVLDLIRRDIRHARAVVAEPETLIIDGYGALTRETLGPTHRPAIVTYRLVGDGSVRTLLREQDGLTGDETFRELVSVGVAAFDAELVFNDEEMDPLQPVEPTAGEGNGEPEAAPEETRFPDAVRVLIQWATAAEGEAEDGGMVLQDEVVLR